MDFLTARRGLALLCVLLSACVTSPSLVREHDEAPEAVLSWEEARADPSCVVPLCDEERCAIWRCLDLLEVEDAPSREHPEANQERLWQFAFELMSRFGVNERPFVPYYCD